MNFQSLLDWPWYSAAEAHLPPIECRDEKSPERYKFVRLFGALLSLLAVIGLSACSGAQPSKTATPSAVQQPTIVVENPWVRTTEGSQDPKMTGVFLTLNNPGDKEIKLVSGSSEVAGKTELHEMVPGPEGKQVMQEAKAGFVIPAGGHFHLKPFSYHIMLMQLNRELKIGDQVKIKLVFSNGTEQTVTAPVKKFTEEQDHYHPTSTTSMTPSAMPSAMPSAGSTNN